MRDYRQERSKFWLRIHENDDSSTFVTDEFGADLINGVFPDLARCSPKGWNQKDSGVFTLWIPDDCMDEDDFKEVTDWAERADQHLWLGPNKHTRPYFDGEELDYCLAAGWNFSFETGERTELGEAEYQLKYQLPQGNVSDKEEAEYRDTLLSAVLDCVDCLPYNMDDFVVTTLPAVKEKQDKLAWQLARDVAEELDVKFAGVTLLTDKPDMKNQPVGEKIRLWRDILSDEDNLSIPKKLRGKDVLIVDDLYQSGASVWCFAEFLKETCDADTVVAVTAVKSQRDSDNQ